MPTPAEEILRKTVLPTGLSSEQIRETVPAEIRRRSFFSARTAEAEYLVKARQVCADVAAGRIGSGEARFRLEKFLEQVGYTKETGLTPGHEGAITDIGTIARLDLIVDTQRDMAHSVAMIDAQTDANVEEFPAWRLVRYGSREEPRDWNARWNEAARQVGWKGVARNGDFVALKSSPIWEAIGAGAGNHKDTLGNPFPPFAFNSGMDWESVDRDECEAIGLAPDGKKPRRRSLEPVPADIKRAQKQLGPGWADKLDAWARGEDA